MPDSSNNEPNATTPATPTREDSQRGLIRNAGTVGIWTIASRILGLYRFRLMASLFGATGVADAFNFAFIFPNLTRRLFGEGLLTSAFVPVFSDRLAKGQKDEANRTASVLLCRLFYWLSLGCVGVLVLAQLVAMVLPHVIEMKPYHFLQLKLFQAMLPYLVFINVAAVLMGILNSLQHFLMPAFAPVLLNVFMIGACLFALPYFGTLPHEQIWAVAIAVLLGGVAQLFIQVPPAFARGFKFTPSMDKTDPGYQEVMNNFKPVVLMVAVFQLNVMLDNVIAQVFIPETGPVTYLNMGTSVYQLPWSIISLALGTAALPMLSVFWAQSKKEDFVKTLLLALRLVIFLALPCTVGIMLLSEDIVRLLYGTGRFLENNGEPVRRTAGVVMFSSLGLVFFCVNSILARGLYAMKDMRTPTTTSRDSVAINLGLNLFFVVALPFLIKPLLPMREALDPERKNVALLLDVLIGLGSLKEAGIALASTISNAWQTWMLARAIRRNLGSDEKLLPSAWNAVAVLGGNALMSAVTGYLGYRYFAGNPDWEGFLSLIGAVAGSVIPFWFLSHQYFLKKLPGKPGVDGDMALDRYGVKEDLWPEELKFEYAIYSAMFASAILGFAVWATRDSLPPEGSLIPVMQRALLPVIVGIWVYFTAASSLMSREYDELKGAFERRLKLGIYALVFVAAVVAFSSKMGWI
jgi:putative peptidoglycan lipid II flippase